MMRVVALIPAHDEEAGIEEAVRGLLRQTRPPDEVVVVADNCRDRTVELARAAGATVLETVGNTAKKAGALNQALDVYLPRLGRGDAIFVQDADSAVDPTFLATAEETLGRGLSAVGGTFRGGPGGGFVGWLQRNEYARYGRDVRRLKGKVLVLTGTATLFRASALMDVAAARGIWIPGEAGRVYDTAVLTEDNELTFALMELGHRYLSPAGCTLVTEVMPTWRELQKQRLRWKRGALENLRQYGFPRWSWSYWARQALSLLGCAVTAAYLSTLAWSVYATGGVHLRPAWLALSMVFMLERAVTVKDRGLGSMLAGALLLVEMPFDLFLQAVHVRAVAESVLNIERRW